ncbi:haloacid dehalogenase type II [Chelatococcus sp. SYSU_G07232]|uniref:(S)-2-haloacid dehalogenase n=1 Tax=Chelatococcus albus TaxID=3047466 RepID=A0ABT7AKQ3_9HYPH|nr:haloacid dehalogenase type II [Chelatococcus sp. SYSU_G07232]MDJ1159414.1 haloacid dehalogenase type II [Chelatococcus sp. SYSU_G07232]
MPLLDDLGAGIGTVVFDAYGTLFDVHAAVMRHAAEVGPEAQRFSDLWRAKQLEYTWVLTLAGQWENFRALTAQALDFAFARFPGVDPRLRPELLDAYRRLDVYPEVPVMLARLRGRGLRTAILSNGEATMLAEAVTSAGIADRLDAVLSADAVQVFKPDYRVYRLAVDAFGPADTIAFVSSNRWDVAGAAAFGFAALWVNRAGAPEEYPGLAPRAVLRDLAALGA